MLPRCSNRLVQSRCRSRPRELHLSSISSCNPSAPALTSNFLTVPNLSRAFSSAESSSSPSRFSSPSNPSRAYSSFSLAAYNQYSPSYASIPSPPPPPSPLFSSSSSANDFVFLKSKRLSSPPAFVPLLELTPDEPDLMLLLAQNQIANQTQLTQSNTRPNAAVASSTIASSSSSCSSSSPLSSWQLRLRDLSARHDYEELQKLMLQLVEMKNTLNLNSRDSAERLQYKAVNSLLKEVTSTTMQSLLTPLTNSSLPLSPSSFSSILTLLSFCRLHSLSLPSVLLSSLISVSVSSGQSSIARHLLNELKEGEVSVDLYNQVMSASLEKGEMDEVRKGIEELERKGGVPNVETYAILMQTYENENEARHCYAVHVKSMDSTGPSSVQDYNRLLSAAASRGHTSLVISILADMQLTAQIESNVETYELILLALTGLVEEGRRGEGVRKRNEEFIRTSVQLLLIAKKRGLELSSRCYDQVIRSCLIAGESKRAFELVEAATQQGIKSDPYLLQLLMQVWIEQQERS